MHYICDGRDPALVETLVFEKIKWKFFGSSKERGGGRKRDLCCRQRCNCIDNLLSLELLH